MLKKITLPVNLETLPTKLNANTGYSALDVKSLLQENEEAIQATTDENVETLASNQGATHIGTSTGKTIEERLEDIDSGSTAILTTIRTDAVNHKSSNDHDGTYYTKTLLDNGQLDTRYFTESEITALEAAMQLEVNKNAADITTLNNLIAVLNKTYSTDVERINAIAQVVADYEAADNDMTTLLSNKVNSGEVYTKEQIDGMTLGSYKMDIKAKHEEITTPKAEIDINVAGFNADTDSISVYTGGVLMTYGVDWKYNLAKDKILKFDDTNWETDITVDWLVIRNLRVLLPSDEFEGALIKAGTVTRDKLSSGVIDELDGLRVDTDVAQSTADSNTTDIGNNATAISNKAEQSTVTTHTNNTTIHRNIILSTGNPTGGNDGDIWIKYTN